MQDQDGEHRVDLDTPFPSAWGCFTAVTFPGASNGLNEEVFPVGSRYVPCRPPHAPHVYVTRWMEPTLEDGG
jgi:hypothetical protein